MCLQLPSGILRKIRYKYSLIRVDIFQLECNVWSEIVNTPIGASYQQVCRHALGGQFSVRTAVVIRLGIPQFLKTNVWVAS
jgi:hypothetical protein